MSLSIKRWFSIALMGMALPHAVAFADMSQSVAPPMRVALFEPGFVFCYEGGGCVAPWSSLALPSLSINESLSITTESTDFNFYLGNNLSGSFAVLLSPAYPCPVKNIDAPPVSTPWSTFVFHIYDASGSNFLFRSIQKIHGRPCVGNCRSSCVPCHTDSRLRLDLYIH